jgi:O-antigen/teichoic acid export membrane protein
MLSQFIARVKQSNFGINVAKLASASILSQVVSLATAPIMYRLYTKEAYGLLGLYFSITSLLGVFSTMMLSQIVLLAPNEKDAIRAASLSRIVNISVALFFGSIFFVAYSLGLNLYGDSKIMSWMLLAPVSLFFTGQGEVFRVWGNRNKDYQALSFNTLLSAILVPIVAISVGFLHQNSPLGLFLGLLLSQILPTIVLQIQFRNSHPLPFTWIDKATIVSIVRVNKDMSLYAMPAELINRATQQMPVFILQQLLGLGVVGTYNLSVRMLALPVNVFSGALSEVFRQRAANDYNETGSCRPIFVKTLKLLSLSLIVPFILLAFVGPSVFAFIFGEKWRLAGVFSALLAPMFYLKLVVSPLTYVFFITKKMKEDFYLHLLVLVLTTSFLYGSYHLFHTSEAVIAGFSVSYCIIYLYYLIRSYQLSQSPTSAPN